MPSYSKILRIVRLRQMLRRWRVKAATAAQRAPSDVPSGHVAVIVGSDRKRFVVRATYLNHPVFSELLVLAEEEYGFANTGPLSIPCDESLFEEIIRRLSRWESRSHNSPHVQDNFLRNCLHDGCRSKLELLTDAWPLLH